MEARERRATGRFLVEGVKHVRDAIENGSGIYRLFVYRERLERSDHGQSLLQMLESVPSSIVIEVNERAIAAISDVETNQGAVAEVAIPAPPADVSALAFLLVLDHIADPGNMGTIIRSAVASGVVDGIVTIGGTDPYGPKSVRSSAAALAQMPILGASESEFADLIGDRLLVRTGGDDGISYGDMEWPDRCALIVGSEGSGVSLGLGRLATVSLTIPIAGRVESLNAGVAASILLFDVARRRGLTR